MLTRRLRLVSLLETGGGPRRNHGVEHTAGSQGEAEKLDHQAKLILFGGATTPRVEQKTTGRKGGLVLRDGNTGARKDKGESMVIEKSRTLSGLMPGKRKKARVIPGGGGRQKDERAFSSTRRIYGGGRRLRSGYHSAISEGLWLAGSLGPTKVIAGCLLGRRLLTWGGWA